MRFTLTFMMSISFLAIVAACSSSSDTTPDTPIQAGQKLVTSNACGSCHGDGLAGNTTGVPGYASLHAPNLTPDKDTGLGGWTDAQLMAAIRTGTDDEGEDLCFVMPRFTNLSDSNVANIVAYLRSIPAVSKDIADTDCPTDGGAADASKD